MALKTEEQKWIVNVTKVKDEAETWNKNRQAKESILSDLSNVMSGDSFKLEIFEGEKYKLTEEKKAGLGNALRYMLAGPRTMSSVDEKHHDPDKEIDTWNDMPGMQGLPREEIRKILVTHAKLVELQRKMELAVDGDGKPLFTDAEIRKELWTPLVREGIIPENAVPDRFSEVMTTFEGANALYEERLKQFTSEQDSRSQLLSKLTLAKDVTEALANIGSNIAEVVIGVNPGNMGPEQLKKAKEIADLTKTLTCVTMSGGFAIAEGVIKRESEGIVDAVKNIVKQAVIAGCSQTGNKEIGKLVGQAIDSAVNAGKFGKHLANGEVEKAVGVLGDYFATGLAMCDYGSKSTQFADIGGYVKLGLAKAVSAKRVMQALTKTGGPDTAAILSEFTSAANEVAGKMKSMFDESNAPKDETEEQKKAREAKTEKAISQMEKDFGKLDEASLALYGLTIGPEEPKEVQELKKRIAAMERQKDVEEIEAEQQEFQNMLSNAFAVPTGDEEEDAIAARRALDSIDALIVQMQKDRMILEMADQLISAGLNLTAQFVPQIAVVISAKEFAKRLVAAALRAKELNEWLDNLEDATTASSVYAAPIKNRVKNSKVQLSQETIQAILACAQMVGAAAACTGMDYGVGTAVQKAAAAGSVAADLLYKVYTEAELAAQWRTYKQALDQPKNRKLLRKTMRGNPTLAKYTMAYGAVVARDPIAMECMHKCQLTDKTLTNPSTNCHKVVQFLEIKFADDPVLLRCIPDTEAWHPGKPELTISNWMSFKVAAQTHKDLDAKLERNPPTGAIEGGLAAVASAEKAADDAIEKLKDQRTDLDRAILSPDADIPEFDKPEDEAALASLLEQLEILEAAFNQYRPYDTEGKVMASMAAYVEAMGALCQVRQREVRKTLAELQKQRDEADLIRKERKTSKTQKKQTVSN